MGQTHEIDLNKHLPSSPPDSQKLETARTTWRAAAEAQEGLQPRSGTPVTDAFREAIKDPGVAQQFAATANAMATMQQVASKNAEPREPIQATAVITRTGTPPTGTPIVAQPITFADFEKIDIRVGEVVEVAPVPKSDKLLRLGVDFGPLGTRTVLSGIAKSYPVGVARDSLVGNRYAFVVNFAPRKMMGIESHGMVLAASDGDSAVLLNCGSALPGTRIG